ncbi:MAG: twin-arginine translocation signal domain-containing protein [Chloroflexi bacterium]|nr:twin-arginine translocation signal domain-containing protein [Chloroflexota bacterium]
MVRNSTRKARLTDPTRRQLLRRLAVAGAAALLLPTVISIVAPQAAEAASCVTSCAGQSDCVTCIRPNQTCTGRCCGGTCKTGCAASGC